MAKPRVCLTRRWPQEVEDRLARDYDLTRNIEDQPFTPDQLRQALRDHDALLPTVTDALGPDVLNAASDGRARFLGNYGVGYAHIDAGAAHGAGLVVTNTPDVLSECTADIAMTLLLMVARRAGEGERELRAGAWTGWRPSHMIGTKVSGKTLGIVGFGRIGQEMARRAHHGFGMQILVQNRSAVAPDKLGACNATQCDSLDALLAQSDFVSLHCPGGAENRHLINADRLAAMKPGAFLINTARGEVVDEAALAQAITDGAIAGAGLDVFDGEPRIHPALLSCDNLVMLPHLGSGTRETRNAMGHRVADNLDDFFAGRPPRDQVI